jgi:hypothetical protein
MLGLFELDHLNQFHNLRQFDKSHQLGYLDVLAKAIIRRF